MDNNVTDDLTKIVDGMLYNSYIFSEESIKNLKNIMYEKKVKRSCFIFEEGDKADKLYFLYEGKVNISKVMTDGKIISFFQFNRFDLFGEYGYIEGKKNSFSAKTLTDCRVGIIFQKDLDILLWQDRKISLEFMKWLAYMRQLTETKLRDLLFFGKSGALASTLIRIANMYGRKDEEAIYITKKFTNGEIADLIGATRETVNRMLNQLKRESVIRDEKGFLIILNIDKLRNLCHCEGCPKYVCRL
ncbi:Crp/Fnr family transcriptional regulator [Metabacillus fastidiosus]|uniref:Crp/Fnr family transcriptional regulator n=1 Tax=Metabacillus fastidiosus TaxID=1458 RepID=UPI003D2D003A